MSIDLKKLENKLDEALSNETSETLTKFLTDRRMSNNKQSSVEWFAEQIKKDINLRLRGFDIDKALKQAKAMQQEQAQLYATFVLKCVQNNLPPITFNDWINLENNEQQ